MSVCVAHVSVRLVSPSPSRTTRNIRNGPADDKHRALIIRHYPYGRGITGALRPTLLCQSAQEVLELSEEGVEEALQDARQELMQMFDESVGMSGTVELAELDGPFVKLRLQGKFWHKRADVLARVSAYVRRRIPDILEIDIEDESQLDDSASNF